MEPTVNIPTSTIEGKGMDLDASRRPGVPAERKPEPWPNARIPPTRQESDVKVFKHNRPNKTFPPVFGTAVPPKGLSGAIRSAAYARPDHETVHWLLLLLSDRVDAWEHRLRRYAPFIVGGAAVVASLNYTRRRSQRARWWKRALAD